MMVYVMGEVMHPGSIPMRGQMTVLQALAWPAAFVSSQHERHPHPAEGGRVLKTVETIRFNYNEAVKGNSTPIFLSPGDMVVVP